MAKVKIILYQGWGSSASRKVRLTLAEKGLEHEKVTISIKSHQHLTDWYKKLNPSGLVPALTVNGHSLIESNLINEYLDEAFPDPPLMPDDPLQRHEVRRWSKYVDDVCLPAVQRPNWIQRMQPIAQKWSDIELEERLKTIPTQSRRDLWYRMARNPFTPEEVAAALDVLEDMCGQIESYLEKSSGPWTFGERFTLADINVAPYVMRFEEERPGRLKGLTLDWWSRLRARPSWKLAEIGKFEEDSQRSEDEKIQIPA